MAELGCAIKSPKDALRELAACPICGKVSQLRNLSYKHKCKRPVDQDTIRKKHALKLQALQDRATKRLKNPALEEEAVCEPCLVGTMNAMDTADTSGYEGGYAQILA